MGNVLRITMVLLVCGGMADPAAAQQPNAPVWQPRSPVGSQPAASRPAGTYQGANLPREELEKILGPIALYPDVLLAQILPAATFPLDIVQAARWLRSKPDMSKLQDQRWDPSVLALCNYPQVLYKMDEDLDWTNALGTAFLDQQKDVMATIQDLRRRAQAAGALKSTPEQTVVADQGAITIAPAQPEVIYVPQYNPQVVYVTQPVQTVVVQEGVSTGTVVAASAISFGVGLALGRLAQYRLRLAQPWGGLVPAGQLARLRIWRSCLGPQPGRGLGAQPGDGRRPQRRGPTSARGARQPGEMAPPGRERLPTADRPIPAGIPPITVAEIVTAR